MKFEEQNNETKITTMLDKIYKKLAEDSAEVDTNLDAYSNDVKLPILLEKIYAVIDNLDEGAELTNLKEDIGDLFNLTTTSKTDLVSAINEIASGQTNGLSAVGVTANYVPTADGNDDWSWQPQQGGGGGVTVDSGLSTTSENPVQNKVITTAFNGKADSSTTYTKTEVDTALSGKAGTSVATTSANGLMSSTDKGRLDDLYADYSSALTALGVI